MRPRKGTKFCEKCFLPRAAASAFGGPELDESKSMLLSSSCTAFS